MVRWKDLKIGDRVRETSGHYGVDIYEVKFIHENGARAFKVDVEDPTDIEVLNIADWTEENFELVE